MPKYSMKKIVAKTTPKAGGITGGKTSKQPPAMAKKAGKRHA